MAERRMFTKKIIDSDAFLDMPLSTQSLYFHLNMRADDDGFVNNPKKIQRMIGASEDDLKLLVAKRFILCFENGVIVIKHWRMHNLLRKDRYNPTQYAEELDTLMIKDNGSYTEKPVEIPVATSWQPSDNQLATQDSIGKVSIEKYSIDKEKDNNMSASVKRIIKTEINEFFESVWQLYPVKKGKGQVSDSKRKALYEIGFDEINRAIERYLEELKKDASWRKPQNGSTFFNSGYVDYLDKNFVPDEQPETQPVKTTYQSNYSETIQNRVSIVDSW